MASSVFLRGQQNQYCPEAEHHFGEIAPFSIVKATDYFQDKQKRNRWAENAHLFAGFEE